MASNLASELSGTQVVELVSRLGRAGLSPDLAKMLMGDDDIMKLFVSQGLDALKLDLHAYVVYKHPSYAELEKAFDRVHNGYRYVEFKLIDATSGVVVDTREIGFELVHLNNCVSTDKALAELDERALRPALYEELLAFAAKYPDLQKQFPVVALGSVCLCDRCLCSPCIRWDGGGRCLGFILPGRHWNDAYRFLAVRK